MVVSSLFAAHQVYNEQASYLPVWKDLMMTRKEMASGIRKMREYRNKVTSSKEEAQRALVKAGILTRDGKVAKPYRKLLTE